MIEQKTNQQSTLPPKTEGDLNYSSEQEQSVASLADADYEFLFNQLLEGVAHGWHSVKIDKFFQRLGERGQPELWVSWLERYQTKIMANSNAYEQHLAARMMRLGEITRSIPKIKPIGTAAYSIGREILQKKNVDLIWEYNGSDSLEVPQKTATETKEVVEAKSTASENEKSNATQNNVDPSNFNQAASWIQEAIAEFVELAEKVGDRLETDDSTETEKNRSAIDSGQTPKQEKSVKPEANLTKANESKPAVSEEESTIDLSWQEFTRLIETDARLAEQIAQQLELKDKDPQNIINAILNQINNRETVEIDESTLELVESWFNLGLKQASAGDLSEAVVSWNKALELNPNLAEAWHNRGSALGRMGDYQQALQSFDRALDIDPQNYHAWNDRAHTLYQLQQWQEALASWDKAISIVPGNHQFWYNRGCTLEQLHENTEAIASYEKALEIKPDFLLAKSRYASLLANQNPIN